MSQNHIDEIEATTNASETDEDDDYRDKPDLLGTYYSENLASGRRKDE